MSIQLSDEDREALRREIAARKHKRETFGQLKTTPQAAARLKGLATAQGWDELRVEMVALTPSCTRYKLTGIPTMRIIDELNGVHGTQTNAPRVVHAKRRKGQDYRFGGGT